MRRLRHRSIVMMLIVSVFLMLPVLAGTAVGSAPGSTTLFWDFENVVSSGGVSNAQGLSSDPSVIFGFLSQTGGGPAEYWGQYVHLTRFFGSHYPFMQFTTTTPMRLESLSFLHIHNHNPGYPTSPSYQAQLQIDTGSGFTNIGAPVLLSPQTSGLVATVSLGDMLLNPGTYQIRWIPIGLRYGSNTSSEFFALDNVTLRTKTPDAIPPVIVATATTADGNAYASGAWTNQDVTVHYTCSDEGGSGLSGPCPADQTLSSSGSASATISDNAGNVATSNTITAKIDKLPPAIAGAPDHAANGSGWYNGPVMVSFTCTDGDSGVASCSGPVTLSAEGTAQSATGSASDVAGNTASATVSSINIDLTAPSVAYSGNAGSYAVDQTVSITCSATDALSGVASSTCTNVSGAAYDFAIGANAYSASATDNAGNTGAGSVSFTVSVSHASLCNLTTQFVTNKGIANSLCAKLENAAKQAAAGKAGPSRNMLQAYMAEVGAQSGKALTAAQAEILTRLAQVLANQL